MRLKGLALAVLGLLLLLAWRPAPPMVAALSGPSLQDTPNISVILIIDNSGSMSTTDPLGLRYVAARQLIDMLEPGDEVSVVLFADSSKTVVAQPARVTDLASKSAIIERVQTEAPSGNTNMRAALTVAAEEMAKMTNPTRFAIFLTDGELYPPNWEQFTAAQQDAERQAVLALADQFGAAGTPIYAVSLADATDPALLQSIAERSHGSSLQAATAEQLTPVFQKVFAAQKLDIFEVLHSGPLPAGSSREVDYPVHRYVRSLTIFVTYASGERPEVSVIPPGSTTPLTPTVRNSYDVYTFVAPEPGLWKVNLNGHPSANTSLVVSASPRASVDVVWNQPATSLATGSALAADVSVTAIDPATRQVVPVQGATAAVVVIGADQSRREYTLTESGNGQYTGQFATVTHPGDYVIELEVRTPEGVLAQRQLRVTATGPVVTATAVTTPVTAVTPVTVVTPVATATAPAVPTAPPTPTVAPSPGLLDRGLERAREAASSPLLWVAAAAVGGVVTAGVALAASRPRFPDDFILYTFAPQFQEISLRDLQGRFWRRTRLKIGGKSSPIAMGLSRPVAEVVVRRGGRVEIRRLVAKEEIKVNGDVLDRLAPLSVLSRIQIGEQELIASGAYWLQRARERSLGRGPDTTPGISQESSHPL